MFFQFFPKKCWSIFYLISIYRNVFNVLIETKLKSCATVIKTKRLILVNVVYHPLIYKYTSSMIREMFLDIENCLTLYSNIQL